VKKKDHRLPDFYYSNIWNIDYNALQSRGYKNLIIDVDNTIAVRGSDKADERAARIMWELLDSGNDWKICLVSNIVFGKKREERVRIIAKSLGVPWVAAWIFDMKPNPGPFLNAMRILKSTQEDTVIIGDQIFTDIVWGNRLGLLTILVKPLGPDHWATNLSGKRNKERIILQKMGILLLGQEIDKGEKN